jgi:hypothetical protein
MAKRVSSKDYYAGISELAEVFGKAGKNEFSTATGLSRDVLALTRAEAWLDNCEANLPKHCKAETLQELRRSLLKARYLVRQARIDELIEIMHYADTLKEYRTECGTKSLAWLHHMFTTRVGGGERIDFRSYVEAAAQAALKSHWNSGSKITLLDLNGNTLQKLALLFEYAGRLGFVCEPASDENGDVAIVLAGVKKKATTLKKVKRAKSHYANSTAALSMDGLTSI